MADFTDLGAHCSDPYCNQVDFLPFRCDCCRQTFCLIHFQYKSHNCPKASNKDQRAAVCPICQKMFAIVGDSTDDNISTLWEKHLRSDCTGQAPQKRKCPASGCKEKLTESSTYHCEKCGQDVCMKHRYEDSHSCRETIQQAASSRSWFSNLFGKPGRTATKNTATVTRSTNNSTIPSNKTAAAKAKPNNKKWSCGRCGQCKECKASREGAQPQWSCNSCTLLNPNANTACGACGRPKPKTPPT